MYTKIHIIIAVKWVFPSQNTPKYTDRGHAKDVLFRDKLFRCRTVFKLLTPKFDTKSSPKICFFGRSDPLAEKEFKISLWSHSTSKCTCSGHVSWKSVNRKWLNRCTVFLTKTSFRPPSPAPLERSRTNIIQGHSFPIPISLSSFFKSIQLPGSLYTKMSSRLITTSAWSVRRSLVLLSRLLSWRDWCNPDMTMLSKLIIIVA